MKALTLTMSLSRPLPADSEIRKGDKLTIHHGRVLASADFIVERISDDRKTIELRGKS